MAKKKSGLLILLEIILSIALGFLVFDLGIFTFIGYLIAFFGALKNRLFHKKKKMPLKLFFGTIIIYLAGKLTPMTINKFVNGDLLGATLMAGLILYIWISGRKLRKRGDVK